MHWAHPDDFTAAEVASQRFASAPCRRAIAAAAKLWQGATTRRARLHSAQEVWRVNISGRLVWYIRNQKVASQAVISHMRHAYRSQRLESFILPYNLRGFPNRNRGDFVFTVVRDPISAARSAYLEVSRRWPPRRLEADASFRSFPCTDARSAEKRYLAFLSEVKRGGDLGSETFHANPQALKLSVTGWIDAFVQVERLATVGTHSGQMLLRRSGLSLVSMLTAPPAHATATTAQSACSFNLTQTLEREICKFYAADYACLPYEPPLSCRGL